MYIYHIFGFIALTMNLIIDPRVYTTMKMMKSITNACVTIRPIRKNIKNSGSAMFFLEKCVC